MVTFFQIQNIDKLFDMFDGCSGAIYIIGLEGDKVDIRRNRLVRNLLKSTCKKHGIESLNISYQKTEDLPRIINYLLSCNNRPIKKY